jgi:DnaK suppressor protein
MDVTVHEIVGNSHFGAEMRSETVPIDEAQRAELRADLEGLVESLRVQIESAREGSRPVGLDQPIGRVSRMDAIQQQSMTQANRGAARQRLAQAEAALRRFDPGGDYGVCAECGEDVGYARLKARPESSLCVACQRSREAGR